MRGWDYGSNGGATNNDTTSSKPSTRRFLIVHQGLRLPYHPNGAYSREPGHSNYTADRDRLIGFRTWNTAYNISFYDSWIGEGFSPREVRAILGLVSDDKTPEGRTVIRGTYVYSSAADELGKSDLEKQGYYVPVGATE
jgi:hypothetical protein